MMKKTTAAPKSVSAYIAAFPPPTQKALKVIRSTIRKTLPKAREEISYGIPVYRAARAPVIYFAGWKNHYSIYPANKRLLAAFKDELEPYDYNDKGTIRFPLFEPIPVKLIASITRFLAQEVRERGKMVSDSKRPSTARA
jgi:uncharacterized protein YdhG (YjbR/CyaY superfamily)